MEEKIILTGRCPNKHCKVVSGFSLTKQQIKENEKYYCQDCGQEYKLSKWKQSSEREYLIQMRSKEIVKNKMKRKR